ncbi:septum formation initiator family protein [Lactobacillus sp. LC28-10]|uniref:Septum formation initiator family protein n=1 Tax=Secundilactobacillus angelensis TaxID=2722706 RepID=A0ABX1KY71_9LACO|nr:septum formation initiator family protein [Secundilactobacillus angelensis]MCH5463092.1 septum formation initiator family protein [Secundilactobacillus angelensis]NLR18899.1 septum formation initiator family protein [Secundilactobacillus angelensis]
MAKQSNITQLDNQYTREVNKSTHRAVLSKQRKKRALIIISGFCLAFFVLGFKIVQAKNTMSQTNVQITRQQQKLTRVKQTHQNLNEHVKLLNNKNYLENLIRSKYYYAKSGETIYSLPNDKANDVTAK